MSEEHVHDEGPCCECDCPVCRDGDTKNGAKLLIVYLVELAVCYPDGEWTSVTLEIDAPALSNHHEILAAAEDLIDEVQDCPGHVAIGLLRYEVKKRSGAG